MFRMVTTFSSESNDVKNAIRSVKHWYLLSEFYYFEGSNNYINGVHELISDDHRHAEYYVLFHDKEFYELWYELFNDRYVAVKEECFALFREKNLIVTEYLEDLTVSGVSPDTQPLSKFETKFPGKFTKKLLSIV